MLRTYLVLNMISSTAMYHAMPSKLNPIEKSNKNLIQIKKSKNGHHEQVRHRDVVEQQWFTRVKCQTGYCGQIKSQDLDG